jgi:hypothetical protein
MFVTGEKLPWVEATEVQQLQESVLNYATALHAIWPQDYAGLVIMRVLVEAKWGEVARDDEKKRVALVKKFFGDTVRENCSRAVRDEPPLDYEQTKTKWTRVVENMFPQFSVLGGMSFLANLRSSDKPNTQAKAAGGNGGNNNKLAAGRGGRGGGGNTGNRGPAPQVSGLSVCYGFNTMQGCGRTKQGQHACIDAKGVAFAHYCNWWDTNSKKFCLQPHPRTSVH